MKIDTALYNNDKRHWQWWYFIVDTILSLSHQGTTLLFSWCLCPVAYGSSFAQKYVIKKTRVLPNKSTAVFLLGLYNILDRYSRYLQNRPKLKQLGSKFGLWFPLPSTHHNFAVWLREIVKERFYCTADFEVTRNAFGRPVGTTLKLDFNGRQADGRALSFQHKLQS